MPAHVRPLDVTRILGALAFFALACGLPTAPSPGTDYALLTVNGRRLPTWITAQPPQDSVYGVVLGEEFDVTSSNRMIYSVWVGEAHRHVDGTFTYALNGCWQGFAVDYHQRADTLFLALANEGTYLNPPTVPPILLAEGSDLVQPTIAGDFRYIPAHPVAITC